MARIIYAVAGEGFGHSSRTHLIGQKLLDSGHDVLFVGSRNSLAYLKQYFGHRVKEVFGLSFSYEGGRVDKSETLIRNLLKYPVADKMNYQLFKKTFEPFDPELVISDFEPFSGWWAYRNRIPFISIDHEHMLTLCKLEHPYENWFSRVTASAVTAGHYMGAVAYIILNFFKAPVVFDKAIVAPPVIRPEVSSQKYRPGEYIVVYSTTGRGEDEMQNMLAGFSDRKFYVYGFGLAGERGNCIFKKRSTEGFLNDLASAGGVIATAGFTLISECLYFKKPMLLLPVAGQYEQIINAQYVEKLGRGIKANSLDEQSLGRFLDHLDRTRPDDDRILPPDNDVFFRILQKVFNRLRNPIEIDI